MALQRQPDVLAQAVGDQVEVAGPRTGAFGLRSLDPVLEAEGIPYALLARQSQPQQVLGRLDEHGHLVTIVLAAVMEAVHRRPDRCPQDRSLLDELQRRHLAIIAPHAAAGRLGW